MRQNHTMYIEILLIFKILLMIYGNAVSDPVNVALKKPVTALYTCGIFGMESFSTLSDAYGSTSQWPRRVCQDLRPFNFSTKHSPLVKPSFPPEAMVDGDVSTSWQSASRSRMYTYGQELILEVSKKLESIIVIDLLQEFLVESIKIQLGDALTPKKVSILRSPDGRTFTPWIYGVSNLDHCSSFFNVAMKSAPASGADTICIGYTADDIPPGDVISVNLSQVPVNLKEWQLARYVKINFFDMLFVYPYNTLAHNFNHYSVSEITIIAECPCNGHQVGCEINPASGMYECVCGGNTMGQFCEACLPLFNQFPFQFGEPCVACNCFQHATSCFYKASVENGKLSLDNNGNKSGGGVCLDCQHNTAGVNCEKCASLYYRPVDRPQTAEYACVPCQCNESGSAVNPATGLIDCNINSDTIATDGKNPGDCYCKTNVMGTKCSQCKPGFYNLQQMNPDGCSSCGCLASGTINSSDVCTQDAIGQCSCKANVEGRACDQCKDGYYGLVGDNINGCSACDCDVGGSVNQLCDKTTGQCLCQSENIIGRQCDSIRPNFYCLSPHGIYSELEDSFGQVDWKRDPQFPGFSGGGYAVVKAGLSVMAMLTVPYSRATINNYTLIVRYHSNGSSNITLHLLSSDLAPIQMLLPTCPEIWCEMNTSESVIMYSGPNLVNVTVNIGQALLDKLIAVPMDFIQSSQMFPFSLPAGCDILKNTVPSNPSEAAVCQRALFFLTIFFIGAPLPCNCDIVGSSSAACNVNGGQCNCKPGVIDRICDKCAPDHFNFSSVGCKPCQCDEYGTICDHITGQCDCPDNTMGLQCDLCVPNTWGWNKTQGCKTCECNHVGSASQQCQVLTGSCTCRTGVEGINCDQCIDGFFNLSDQGCSPCLCNDAGSVGTVCDNTTGQCICKENTGGRQCDTCLNGTFGLDMDNPKGCLDCICMGITTQCVSAMIRLSAGLYQLSVKTNNGVVPSLNIVGENNEIVNISFRFEDNPDSTSATDIDITDKDPRLFWQMPNILVSSLLSLYGTDISFTATFIIVAGQSLTDHKALIIDHNGDVIMHPLLNVTQGHDMSLFVTLRESNWQKNGAGTSLTRGEFIKVLSSATAVLLPASFATGNHTSRLSRLQFSYINDVGLVSPAVENCICGAEYMGRSCELCAPGYRRENVSNSDFLGICVPCECNGHAATCDADTGICQDCQNNTAGQACNECVVGFYGNAAIGTQSDCLKCPCYPNGVINATCEKSENSTVFVCPHCKSGYIGIHCLECDLLYYGDPNSANGSCLPCECNGNADSCDSLTGICSSCTFNTTGNKCERCVAGFYGNASLQNCQDCQCVPTTSNSTLCDDITGQCSCVYGVGGRSCDQCLMGFWGYDSPDFLGCKACECVEAGSLSIQCDNSTGKCPCKANTIGSLCDTCVDGFYGLPSTPCQACLCNSSGSINTSCNVTNGQCECKPGIGERQCDQCLPFFVNFSTSGCQECGLCQKSLGENVDIQSEIATELLESTLAVIHVQMEDTRLQILSSTLNKTLDGLGLDGSNQTSIEAVMANMTRSQAALVSDFQKLQDKATSLASAAQFLIGNSNTSVTRQLDLAQAAANLSKEIKDLQSFLNYNVLLMTQYNTTASQYLNRTASAGNITITFEAESETANLLLSQAQNTSSMEAVNAAVYQQTSDIATINSSISTLSQDMDAMSVPLASMTLALNDQSYTTASVDSILSQANVFKLQSEELKNAALNTITRTENRNTESQSALSAARAAVRNTNSVYSGDATSVMTWAKESFPSGVSNFETGIAEVKSLQTLIQMLIDRVQETVNSSESHVKYLEEAFANLSSAYQNISTVGKDAVEAIDNYKKVLANLDSAASSIASANQLLDEVRENISGSGLDRLQQASAAEIASSDALRQQLMDLDYGPQVIESSLITATTKLDNEVIQQEYVNQDVNAVTAAAQSFSLQVTGNTLKEQITNAQMLVDEALSISQASNNSAAIQDEELKQKQAELDLVDEQIALAKQLQQNVSQMLSDYHMKYEAYQMNLTSAKNRSNASLIKTKEVSDKIQLLQSKLTIADGLLEKLRQPVNFDGSLGLQLKNPLSSSPLLFSDVILDMTRLSNFTDGVILFVDNPGTNDELEIGLVSSKVFMEFNTGSYNIRIVNQADICDGCWARVYATRYGTVGHLTVMLMPEGIMVSNSDRAPADVSARTLALTSDLFIGSLPASKQTTKVAARTFMGCLFNVKYQDQMLNLWTSAISSTKTAKCCQPPPQLPDLPITQGISFTGFGYLVVSPRSLQFSVIKQIGFEIRTHLADATLLTVTSTDSRTKWSLSLISGYVVWEILSGGVMSTLQSLNHYLTGQWIEIQVAIDGKDTKLSVKYVDNSSSLSATSITREFLDLTPLDGQNIVIGTHMDPLQPSYMLSNTNFAGCLRKFSLTSPVTKDLSLTENVVASLGVSTNGCYENNANGLGFLSESAFAQISPMEQLQQIKNLEFDIITEEPYGMLVYIRASDALRFLYLAVFGGNVILIYRQDDTASVISSGQFVSDGLLHTIKIDCTTFRVSLRVDTENFEETSQTLTVDFLAFPANSLLVLGGLTAGEVLQPECPVKRSLIGGISRFLINTRSVSLVQTNIVDKKDITLAGIPVSTNTTSNVPIDPLPLNCATPPMPAQLPLREGFFMDGTRDINWSELATVIRLPEYFEKSFALEIDFSVFKADGVLIYTADVLSNPRYYFIVYLMDGLIHLRMMTTLIKEHDIHLAKHYNTGQQIKLKIMKINDFVSMLVDSEKDYINTEANANTTSQLAIPALTSIYIGGIGPNAISSSALPQQITAQISKINFAGSIFSVTLKSQESLLQNITLPIGSLNRTAYPAVPSSAYYGVSLSGDNSYLGLGPVNTTQNIMIEIQFTTVSESGLFFLWDRATSARYLAMDIYKQQLRLHLYPSFNGVTDPLMLVLYKLSSICDGKPHTVKLEIQGNAAAATVDNIRGNSHFIPTSHAVQALYDADFYIGGYGGISRALPSNLIKVSLAGCIMSIRLISSQTGVSRTYDPTQFVSSSKGAHYSCPY